MSDSLQAHGLQHPRLPCLSSTPGACSDSCPSSQWCHPIISSSIVPFSSCLQSFLLTPWTAAHQPSLSIINSQSLLKLICIKSVMPSIKLVMPSNHFILCRPFSSCLQSFPASGSFQMSQFFTSGSQSIGALASASVLPMNIQDDGLVWSPCSPKELSRELLGHVVILFNFSRNCQTLFLSGYNSL